MWGGGCGHSQGDSAGLMSFLCVATVGIIIVTFDVASPSPSATPPSSLVLRFPLIFLLLFSRCGRNNYDLRSASMSPRLAPISDRLLLLWLSLLLLLLLLLRPCEAMRSKQKL